MSVLNLNEQLLVGPNGGKHDDDSHDNPENQWLALDGKRMLYMTTIVTPDDAAAIYGSSVACKPWAALAAMTKY